MGGVASGQGEVDLLKYLSKWQFDFWSLIDGLYVPYKATTTLYLG